MWWHHFQHWLAVVTGTVNEGGPFYGWWSGFGADLGEVTLVGGVWLLYRKHNCGTKGCWRIGKHPTADGTFMLCRQHHPDMMGKKFTMEEIHHHHRMAQRRQQGLDLPIEGRQ